MFGEKAATTARVSKGLQKFADAEEINQRDFAILPRHVWLEEIIYNTTSLVARSAKCAQRDMNQWNCKMSFSPVSVVTTSFARGFVECMCVTENQVMKLEVTIVSN